LRVSELVMNEKLKVSYFTLLFTQIHTDISVLYLLSEFVE